MEQRSTIPVHIASPDGASRYLTDWPATDLQRVFTLLRQWGVVDRDGDALDVDNAAGDLVLEDGQVIFRVSIESYP